MSRGSAGIYAAKPLSIVTIVWEKKHVAVRDKKDEKYTIIKNLHAPVSRGLSQPQITDMWPIKACLDSGMINTQSRFPILWWPKLLPTPTNIARFYTGMSAQIFRSIFCDIKDIRWNKWNYKLLFKFQLVQ